MPRFFYARLDKIRVWRNAMCHGAWQCCEADDSASQRPFSKVPYGPERLETNLTLEQSRAIRAAAVELTLDIADIVTTAGAPFPGTSLPGTDRMDRLMHQLD